MRSPYSLLPVILFVFGIHGCSSVSYQGNYDTRPTSGYSYVPIDPISVKFSVLANQDVSLIKYLPDNAVRMSVERIDAKGNVEFGVGSVAINGDSLRVTIDYIMADTISVPMFIVTQRFSDHLQMGNSAIMMNDAGFKVLGAHRIDKNGELDTQRNSLEKIYSIRVGDGDDAYMAGGTKIARKSRITIDEYNIPIYI